MINKLRKKLMTLFLTLTMLIFTVAMFIMMSNTVASIQGSEVEYVNNMTDRIIEQVQHGEKIANLDLSFYATKFHTWIYLSDGLAEQSGPDFFSASLDSLLNQIRSGKSVVSMQATTEKYANQESYRTLHLIAGSKNETYYGVHSPFLSYSGTKYDFIIIYPQSPFWAIIRSYCGWYPLLWLGVFAFMYLISHILIKKAVQPAENAMISQKEFIASASHELKAPLAVIQVNTETLDMNHFDAASEQKKRVILEECARMNNLLKSMLALASSDAGNWKMNVRDADIDTLLIETWEMFIESARKQNVRLDLTIDEDYPKLSCDKERLTQVFSILLDNALTYSKPGLSIQIGAKVQTKQMMFYVIDHGCGIADTEKEKVFERFYCGDSSRTNKDHYGMGLSIALEIIKLHQGSIHLKDTPGGGCTFEINIPFEISSH
ncbi:sensor histidine kinase [Gorillibacterium timonense]|uniref:sensor histidine kinase n=1 Tax=Gorillibacterium timonense TaxID=1689269 RepID=UPI00071D63D1|nr:HAMP domain-containing sensor histidine kinase [Gorillibacterium timonense]